MSPKKKAKQQDPTEADTDTVTVDLALDDSSEDKVEAQKAAKAKSTESLSAEATALMDPDLVQRAREVRDQRQVIRTRLKKIESGKGKVKANVYQKVKEDYTARLKETKSALLQVKRSLDEALAQLRSQEAEVTRRVLEHEETLEEAEFRKDLGEYNATEFKAIHKKEEGELKAARSAQNALQQAITGYESLFAAEDLKELTTAEAPLPEKAPPPPNVGQVEPRRASRQGESAAAATAAPTSKVESEAAEVKEQASLLLYENGQVVEQFPLVDELTIGRSPNNQVVLKEARVSRRHAVIRKSGNSYMIVDNNSSNGTYVNSNPITEQILKSGDKIHIGSYEMVFSLS